MTDHRSRYLAVAAACALLHNAVMIGCDLIGIHYAPATGVSYVVVVLFGYALHSHFTFQHAASGRSLLLYALGMAANYPASLALMFVFHDLGRQPVAIAAPLGTMILAAWNFLMSRWAIAPNRGA